MYGGSTCGAAVSTSKHWFPSSTPSVAPRRKIKTRRWWSNVVTLTCVIASCAWSCRRSRQVGPARATAAAATAQCTHTSRSLLTPNGGSARFWCLVEHCMADTYLFFFVLIWLSFLPLDRHWSPTRSINGLYLLLILQFVDIDVGIKSQYSHPGTYPYGVVKTNTPTYFAAKRTSVIVKS